MAAGGVQLRATEEFPAVAVTVGAEGTDADAATRTLLVVVTTPAKPVPSAGLLFVLPPNSTT